MSSRLEEFIREMEALQGGTLVEIVQAEGSTVAVGDVIAYLESDA